MIGIDMEMPKSCDECIFLDNEHGACSIMPSVPAWKAECEKCTENRAEHCPLKEIKE